MAKTSPDDPATGSFDASDEIPPLDRDNKDDHPPHVVPGGVAPYRDDQVSFACGHVSDASFRCCLFGEVYTPRDEVLAARAQCGECFLRDTLTRVVRCTLCGCPILPGQAVALYPDSPEFRVQPWRKIIRHRRGMGILGWIRRKLGWVKDSVLGCTRSGCTLAAGLCFAGHWNGREFVPAFDGKTAGELFSSVGAMIMVVTTVPPSSSSKS